jgi:hypothetical protein
MLNKMISSLALLSLLVTAGGSFAQNLNWKMVGAFQTLSFGSAYVPTRGIHVDSAGNVIGSIFGSIVSGTANAGGSDISAVQYTQTGTQTWTTQFGSSGYEEPLSAAVDESGSLYFAGYISGGAMAASLNYAGRYDVFVAQYDSLGDQLWLQQFGTGADEIAYSVSTDLNGTVYVSGTTLGALAPGAVNAGTGDVFSAVYDSAGNANGIAQFGSSGWDVDVNLAFKDGQILVAGYTTGTIASGQPGVVFLETPQPGLLTSALR